MTKGTALKPQTDIVLTAGSGPDIPVEQPTKFEFAVNAKTAAALGLTFPQTFDEALK